MLTQRQERQSFLFLYIQLSIRMDITQEQSFFGREKEEKIKPKRKIRKLKRLVYLLIEYTTRLGKKYKKRHENQLILFPQNFILEESQFISPALEKEYNKLQYPFYLSDKNLFIDNYHLTILKKSKPLVFKFDILGYGKLKSFAQWVQNQQDNVLIGLTDLNIILIIPFEEKCFLKYKIQDNNHKNKSIVSFNAHKDYLFVFSQNQCHICKYRNVSSQNKGLDKVIQKEISQKNIKKALGLEKNGDFFILTLIQNTLNIQKLKTGYILSKIDNKPIVIDTSLNNFNNLKIILSRQNKDITNIIIAVSTHNEVKIFKYNMQEEKAIKLIVTESTDWYWKSIKTNIPFLNLIQRKNYCLCTFAYTNKVFFIKILPQYCQISKRVKFPQKIDYVGQFGNDDRGMIIITKHQQNNKTIRTIFLSHQSIFTSCFNGYVNQLLLDKYQFTYEIPFQEAINVNNMHIHDKKQIFIIKNDQIDRIVLSTWKDIYNSMKDTENIKLLKFLILLRHISSPFLTKPRSFHQLQAFFPSDTKETKQILLEYYYLMNMQPFSVDLNKDYELAIPFIIAHKISNLNDTIMQSLMYWCELYDERLLQEMIIGGSNYGWQNAVSKGWIRAFKIMVQKGMEIETPIVKLYSFVLKHEAQFKPLNQQSSIENALENVLNDFLTDNKGQKYIYQLTEYIIFVLCTFFKDITGDGSSLEFKNFLTLILKEQIWQIMLKYTPQKSISLISYIFNDDKRIKQINNFKLQQFLSYHKRFMSLLFTQGCSNSELIVSHLSQSLQEQHQDEQSLYIQHIKLLVFKYRKYLKNHLKIQNDLSEIMKTYQVFHDNPYYESTFKQEFNQLQKMLKIKETFSFSKEYLKSLILLLLKEQNSILEKIYRELRQFNKQFTQKQFEYEMILFCIFIWKQIYLQIVKSTIQECRADEQKMQLKQCETKIKKMVKRQIRSFYGQIEHLNYKYQYLTINIMLAINDDNQFTIKIFSKFLICKSHIIQEMLFIWLKESLDKNFILQEQLIKHLKQVMFINKEQSRLILQHFYQRKQKEIIKKIDNDPNLQLEYLQLIIKNADEELEQYYTHLYVELILKIKPETLISILETDNELVLYDFAQILKMTLNMPDFDEKNNILIYLYEREGQIIQCLNYHLRIIQELFYSYIQMKQKSIKSLDELFNLSILISQNNASSKYQKSKIINKINVTFGQISNLTFRSPILKYQYFSIFLDKFDQLLKTIPFQNYKFQQDYMEILTNYFGNFVIMMFERNCLSFLIEWINKINRVDFVLRLKEYFITGYEKIMIEEVILKSMVIMQKNILLKQIHEGLKKIQFCISSTSYCYVCLKKFNIELFKLEGLLFSCGHIYHKECIDQVNGQDFCYYCVLKNQYGSMIQNDSLCLVELLEKYRRKKRQKKNQVKVDIQKKENLVSIDKKRMNRLGLFDKKVTAIQNQAEIIDIKLMIEQYYLNQLKKK